MRSDLVDIHGREADPGRLGALSAYLEAETKQRNVAGIVVALGLTNGGHQDLPLLNPFELIQFQVRDAQGYPRRVRTKPPRLLTHQAGSNAWTLDSPLPIQDVRRNSEVVDPDALDTEILTVGAGGGWRVTFAIDQFVEGDGPSQIEIPEGVYQVGCLATLIDAERRETSRILQSAGIQVHFARET